MAKFGKLWAGHVFGTNTGNLFISFERTEPDLYGLFRFLDNRFGLVVYEVEGKFDGTTLTALCKPKNQVDGIVLGNINLHAVMQANGSLKGHWHSTVETAGTFDAYPHDINAPDPTSQPSAIAGPQPPEQIIYRTVRLGAIQLTADDVRNLIAVVKQEFTVGRVVVTYSVREARKSQWAEAFLEEMKTAGRLDFMQVAVQELEAHGVNRGVTVVLAADDINEIRVQGISETWVNGKFVSVVATLKPNEVRYVTWVRQFGIYVIYLALLVALPGFPSLPTRIGIALGVVVVVIVYVQILKRAIPNAIVDLRPPPTRIWTPFLSQILAGIIALILGVGASYIFQTLTKLFPQLGSGQ